MTNTSRRSPCSAASTRLPQRSVEQFSSRSAIDYALFRKVIHLILPASPTTGAYSLATVLLFFLGTHAQPAAAQNDFFNTLDIAIEDNAANESTHTLIGWLNADLGYGLQNPGALFSRQDAEANKAEFSLFAQWDARLAERSNFRFSAKAYHDEIYRLQDHNPYSRDELSTFRNRFEVKDFYVEHEFDNGIYLKAGNQILAWGMSEYLRVTDLINTENQYTFGQEDLEDLRLQVPAVLASVNAGNWTLDSVITVEAGNNDIAPAGDEFDQFAALRAAGASPVIREPEKQTEFFLRASTQYAHGDLQIVAGEFNDNALTIDRIIGTASASQVILQQNRMRALGFAINRVLGSWLLFSELGVHRNKAIRPANNSLFAQLRGWERKNQLLAVFGAEYNGFRNLILSAEVDITRTQDNSRALYGPATQTSFGVRAYWTALNERLQLVAVSNQLAEGNGRIDRLSIDYDWSDNLSLGMLWVNYSAPASSYVNLFSRNDVLNVRVRYNFQANW